MSDAPQTMTIDEVRTLVEGDVVVVTVECAGDDENDVERSHPAGTEARVLGMRTLPDPQGLAITLAVGEAENERIVVVFDESDECGYAFTRATDDPARVEPRMESAGTELMALTFRLEAHPEFAGDVARLREISGWISVGRMSDTEHAFVNLLGAMVGAMRRRNFAFADDRSISSQFSDFLDSIPEPLPGEVGFVDQATVEPAARRDVFDAVVEAGEVRRWTDRDGVERALANHATVRPDGVHGTSIVYAEGALAPLLVDGAVLRLRSAGGALKVVDEGDMAPKATTRPTQATSRAAATLLGAIPSDQETAAIVAKGPDMVLADQCVSRYEEHAVDRATAIRDALDAVAR
jgi:hypothetical protein